MVGNYALARQPALDERPKLILIDINIGGYEKGINAALGLRGEFGSRLILLLSHIHDDLIRQVAALEPLGLLVKPFQQEEMQATVRAALAKARATAKALASEQTPNVSS